MVSVAAAITVMVGAAATAFAHDGIASSEPEAGSTIDLPISKVTIEFPGPVADDARLTLLDPDENPLDSTTTQLSATVAEVDFEPLAREGTYLVQYEATVLADGHLLIGAMSFTYGSDGSGIGLGVWIGFGVISAGILAVGIAASVRNHRRLAEDES
jgi:copper resistance protein C